MQFKHAIEKHLCHCSYGIGCEGKKCAYLAKRSMTEKMTEMLWEEASLQ